MLPFLSLSRGIDTKLTKPKQAGSSLCVATRSFMPSQTPTELPSVAAAKFVAKVTGAYTIALQELLQDASFNEEMKRQREEEEEREE